MHNTQTQDTSTQAMTEVALGLSMAFFAILIVALLSMGVNTSQAEQKSDEKTGTPEFVQLSEKGAQTSNKDLSEPQYLLYYQGKFYNEQAKLVSLSKVDKSKPLVLALSPDLSLSNIIVVKQQINHANFSITTLDEAWLKRLEINK